MQNQPLLLILKNKNKGEPEQIRTVRIFNFFIFLFFFMVTTLYQPVKKIGIILSLNFRAHGSS